MADRYWVGGAGTWGSTQTTNWSASSGGASGASVPTASDNVFFDVNSNTGTNSFTVTMANSPRVCNDFTASGLDGSMFLAGSGIALTVSGSLTFQATNFTRQYSGTTTFNATTTGKTVTTNGVAFGGAVTFNGVGGAWTLGSAFSCGTSTLTLTNGTFDTSASNYAVTAGGFSSSNSNVRTINLNGSTLTFSSSTGWAMSTSTNATLNAGTSTINFASTSPTFAGGGLTYYNVAFTPTNLLPSASITGGNTFNNLSITGRTTVGFGSVSFSADQTINGTFTVSAGTASAYRIQISSSTFNTARTLTCASIAAMSDVDFRDITIAGAHGTLSGTRLGDCKGNTNITFPAAKTVYYGQTGSANWGDTGSGSWSATSGGALDATQFPLAQDTAVFPAATYPASGSTITVNDDYNIGTIDMSLRTTNTMTLSTSNNDPVIFGSWINGTGITLSATATLAFSGRTTQQITSAGKTFPQLTTINSPGGSVTLQDALTILTISLSQGTLDLQSYTLSTNTFSSSTSLTRTIAFGTGNITCTGTGTVWDSATVTGLTTTGTQVVNVTSTGSSAITVSTGALSEANSISFNFTGGTYALTFLGSSNYSARNANFTGFAGTLAQIGITTPIIYGNLTLSTGMTLTSSTRTLVFGATSGTQQITTNAKTIDFPLTFNGVGGTFQLQDALTMGSTRTATLTNGTLDLQSYTLTTGLFSYSNTNTRTIAFGTGNFICTGTGTVWNGTTRTNLTVTGTPVVNVTSVGSTSITCSVGNLPEASAISFNFTGGTYALNLFGDSGSSVKNVDFTGYAGTLSSHITTAVVYGNFTLSTGMSLTSQTNTLTFGATSGTQLITTNGKTLDFPLLFSGVGGTFQLQDALTMGSTRTATLTNGTLDLNNLTFSPGLFSSNNSNIRTLAFGTGKIDVIGTGTAWETSTVTNFSISGSKTVNFTSVGSTTITCNSGLSEANAVDFNVIGGTYQFRFGYTSGISSVRNLNFTGYAGTWSGLLGDAYIYGNLIMSATMLVGNSGSKFFAATSGTKTITSNGVSLNLVEFAGVGGTWQLQDAMTVTQSTGTKFVNGTVDLNGKTLTTSVAKTETGTKNITFNGGTIAITTASSIAWYNNSPTNFTTTAGTGVGTISMTAATAKSFSGGGSTYNCTINQGGAGDLSITDSNTFNNITNTTQPASVIFSSGQTNTFLSGFSLSGTSGNLITIGSSASTNHTLSKASGTVSVSFCSISKSNGTGGATWEALTTNGNVDGGSNTGWDFGGVIYAAAIAEAATVTDAILGLAAFRSTLSETATATDSVLSRAAFSSALSETATATDSVLGQAAFSSALSETATATDSVSGLAAFSSALSETATATDAILGLAAFSSALAETATATDSPSVAASTFNAPVAETATATDSPSVAASTFNAPVAETATATDSVLGRAAFSSALSETATTTDSVLSFADFYAALSETATATDSVISFADFYAALSEAATATDSVLSFADFYAALSETATATDSVLGLSDLFVSLEETATATDSPLVAPSTFNAPVEETATATDAVSPPGSIYNAPVSETVTISDLVLGLFLWNLIDDSQSVTWQNINSSPGTTWSPIDTDPDTGWSVIPTVN